MAPYCFPREASLVPYSVNRIHSGESGNVGPNSKYFLLVHRWRAPGDRHRRTAGSHFFSKAKARGGRAPQVCEPAGSPPDRVIVSSLGPTTRPCLTICERDYLPEECAWPISVPRIVPKNSELEAIISSRVYQHFRQCRAIVDQTF